jgi:hypothetical protein
MERGAEGGIGELKRGCAKGYDFIRRFPRLTGISGASDNLI